MTPTPFPQLLHAFFHDWLVQQRNVSHHTVLSYRDSWRLFLRFVAARRIKSVARLGLIDLTAAEVLAFLQHAEQERKASIGTRKRARPSSSEGIRITPAQPISRAASSSDDATSKRRGRSANASPDGDRTMPSAGET